jgi:phosphate transport system substrate-binding protein
MYGQTPGSTSRAGSSEGIDGLAVLAHRAQAYTNASGAAIALPGETRGELICRARSGSRAPDVGSVLRLEGTFTGLCVQSGKLVRCNDTETETRVDLAAARLLGVRSMMVAPIGKPGDDRGAFALFSFTPNAFSPTHEAVLKTLADEVTALLSKKAAAPSQETVDDRVAFENRPVLESRVVAFPRSVDDGKHIGPPTPVAVNVRAASVNPVEPPVTSTPPRRPPKRGPSTSLVVVGALACLLVLGGVLWVILRPNRLDLTLASSVQPTFRIHGSNTLGSDCVPALVKAYLHHLGATDVRVTPVRKEEVVISAKTGKGLPVGIEVQSHGSWTGFRDLADGKAELAMASTRLPDAESIKGDSSDATTKRAALEKLKDLKSAATEYVVGLDGIAIIGSPARAASTSLSKQQVCDIFSGKVSDWSLIDAAHPGLIRRYVRDKNSGTRKTFVDICYEGQDNLPGTGPQVLEDSHQLSDSVAKDPDAIGFVGLPFVTPASPIAVEGRLPAESSVRLEEYALTRRLYLYRNQHDPAESGYINDFVEFSLSPEGQSIVRQSGFVDQEIKLEEIEPLRGSPRDYVALTAGARRASLEVRFESSRATIDSKAMRDLARLKKFLEDSHALTQGVLVLGFADRSGTPYRNCTISRERARLVEDQLHRMGVANTMSVAFGQAMPLTEEVGPEGMAKNRRVEIWVTENLHPYTEGKTCP